MKKIFQILMVAGAIVLFYMYIDPKFKEIKILVEEKKSYDDILQKSKELISMRNKLRESYNKFSEEDLNKLNKVVPDTVDNVRLILDIDSIADKYGIILRNIATTDMSPARTSDSDKDQKDSTILVSSGNQFGTIGLSFSFISSYETFKLFLRDLEKSMRIVDVKNLTVSASEVQKEKEGQNFYNYSISLETYWLR